MDVPDKFFLDFLKERTKLLMEKYKKHLLEFPNYGNLKTLKKNIFSNLDFVIYLPTMMKVTLLGVDSLDKNNLSAEISIKVEIKVNLPGFSNSPAFYENLIKNKFLLMLNNENLAGEGAVSLRFDDSSSLLFYNDPMKYFHGNQWGSSSF